VLREHALAGVQCWVLAMLFAQGDSVGPTRVCPGIFSGGRCLREGVWPTASPSLLSTQCWDFRFPTPPWNSVPITLQLTSTPALGLSEHHLLLGPP
jgi:hypothetical protein